MIELTDEILNKYIDGDLDKETFLVVKDQLRKSPENLIRLKQLQKIIIELKNIKEEKVSVEFTSLVMSKVKRKAKAKKSDKIFIFSISSIFVLISLIIVGLLLFQFISLNSSSAESISWVSIFNSYLIDFLGNFKILLTSKNISLFSSIVFLGIILSIYSIYESHKKAKDSLSKLN